MNLIQIEYFLAVAQELNFSSAARSLFVSQPALSRQIVSLEDELGVKLFYRTSRSVRLTDAGASFRDDLERVMRQFEEAKRRVMNMGNQRTAKLRLGCMEGSELDGGLAELVERLKHCNPELQVIVHRMRPQETYTALKEDSCDVIITLDHGETFGKEYQIFRLKRWPSALLYGAASPLAGREMLTIQDFQAEPLLIIRGKNGHALFRNALLDLKAAGIVEPVLVEVENYSSLITNLEMGNGYAVLAETVTENNPKLKSYPLPHSIGPDIVAAWKTDSIHSDFLNASLSGG